MGIYRRYYRLKVSVAIVPLQTQRTMIPPPSIPVQFARPIPTVSTPAPADVLNRPGPYGAQPQGAPRIGGASALPPAAAIPAAGSVAAGAGSSLILPASVLAIPLAIGAGETGNPILSTQNENEAIRRADRARGQERPGSDNPGRDKGGNKNPANPGGSAARPENNPRRNKPPIISVGYQINYDLINSSRPENSSYNLSQTVAGPFGGVTTRTNLNSPGLVDIGFATGDGFSGVLTLGRSEMKFWTVRITNIQRIGFPPNPPAPGQESAPPAQTAPPAVFAPNPTQPSTPPNPTQPTDPTQPTQPTQPINPTIKNPVNPAPLVRGPFAPAPPGKITPPGPGPLTPRSPSPNGPNNTPRPPCLDPCTDLQVDRLSPVVIGVRQFVSCTRNRFGLPLPYDSVNVTVPKVFAPAFQLMFDNQAELLKTMSCQPPVDSVAVIPDWWQVRLGANRPQLLILYARKFSDGTWDKPKYVLSVPHWNKSKDATVLADFPEYEKGDFQGTRVLPDNSKLIVNALSRDEALRVIAKLSASIPTEMIEFAQTSVADRRGAPLRQIKVFPRIARYFVSGQKDLKPTWSKDFREVSL